MISEERRKTILWLLVARPIVLSTVLGGEMILAKSAAVIPATPFLYLLLISYALNLLYLGFSRFLSVRPLTWVQIIGDVALVSAITRISGRADSPLSLLYFLVIVYAATFLFVRGGLAAALVASVSYFLVLFVGQHAQENSLDLFYVVYLHTLLFFLVGVMSGFLAERQKKRGLELHEMKITTDEVLQNMSSGLMSFDRNRKIFYFNRRAEEILELSPEETKGRGYDRLPERLDQLKEEIGKHFLTPNITRRK